jgi:hypothetical protein
VIQLAGLDPRIRANAEAAIASARARGYTPRVTSSRRSWSEQERLWNHTCRCLEAGVAGSPDPQLKCTYPAVPPGTSSHNYGLAFDSTVPPEHQADWNATRRIYGFNVPAGDEIHAEWAGWEQLVDGWNGPRG